MSKDAFDAVTRQAADAMSRRKSMLALGGMALAASFAEPAVAKNKKKKGNDGRAKKQVQKKCRRQVTACRNFFRGFCAGIQECQEEFFPCCEPLARCDSGAMLECLFSCGCSGMPASYQPPS